MPVEAKPLFRPDVLRSHLSGFQMPAVDAAKLRHWASEISSGRLDRFGEQEMLPHFLADFFVGLLGYTGPAGHDRYTIGFERHVEVDGKYADAVLGDFNGQEHYVVALEGKGPRDPLDRPYAGRRRSAVEQAYQYAINLPCDWIIITSMRQTRLYHKGSDQKTYERFDTERLADDEAALRRFLFLLGAERVVPDNGRSHFYDLLAESEKVGRELTKEFYVNYANMRQDAFEQLSRDNPEVSRHAILTATQTLLDRVLFIAFSEDRGLLPTESIKKAYEHRDPYHPQPIWNTFRGLFSSINLGNAALGIHAYNGGLFANDPVLDTIKVSDVVCGYFRELGEFDYKPAYAASGETEVIDVDILGHIFEQSITDLERIRNELDGLTKPVGTEQHRTRRKKEGAFYTPSFITRYIVEQALGGVLNDRFEQLRATQEQAAKGTARAALADPRVYELDKLTNPARKALVEFWESWQDELTTIRLLDPACGSGAFLIEAFDQFHAAYQWSIARLAELRAARRLFHLDQWILENNLYGVDLNEEAIEICRLSLWIKTAQRGQKLTNLDHTIRVGNSVVSDTAVHPNALDWQAAFPEVFKQGGFDVVVANPPYIRQEWLTRFKPHFETRFPEVYSGTADIYVYFYAVGLQLLKPGGRLSFISSNAFARAAYAGRLRDHLIQRTNLRQFIDLGDTQVFSDAKDVYPAMVLIEKPKESAKCATETVRTIRLRREDDATDVAELTRRFGWDVPVSRLSSDGWQFEEPAVVALRERLRDGNGTVGSNVGNRFYRGIITGLNEAFVISAARRAELVSKDTKSSEIIKPFVGGQDVRRWHCENSGAFAIVLPNGFTADRCGAREESAAWAWFSETYPAVASHLEPFAEKARQRGDKGEFWWELRPCDYYAAFELPKILYPDIAKSNRFHLDREGLYSSNTTYFLPVDDGYLLGVLNSKPIWFALAGISIPFGERAGEFRYRLFSQYVERLPIPDATEADRDAIAKLAESCSSFGSQRYELETQFQRRLCQTFGQDAQGQPLGTLNNKAQAWWAQSLNELGDALKTSFKLSSNPFMKPQTADEWEPYLAEKRSAVESLTRQLAAAEAEINARVFRLFNLTPAEITLLLKEVEH